MKMYLECLPCFVTQSLSSLKRANATHEQTDKAMRAVFAELSAIDFSSTPPVTGTRINRIIRNQINNADPFCAEKKHYNAFALSLLRKMRPAVEEAADPFLAAIKLAIAANIIDFGKNGALTESEVHACLGRAFDAHVDLESVERLRRAVADAVSILFLCDNAGEIVFDRLLIEQLPLNKITCAVRGAPAINDATMDDAREAGLTELVTVISNGSDAPGTLLAKCSEAFRRAFDAADLVIAKGQGNFETLSDMVDNFLLTHGMAVMVTGFLIAVVGLLVYMQTRYYGSAVPKVAFGVTVTGFAVYVVGRFFLAAGRRRLKKAPKENLEAKDES